MILADALRFVEFCTGCADDLSFELVQDIEHSLLWHHRHTHRDAQQDDGRDPAVAEGRSALIEAIGVFRDKINADREFVIYKTLVGFKSVFPQAWDDPEFRHAAQEAYRNTEIEALVADVRPENSNRWLERIRRCAATESRDLATFPAFHSFLKALAQAQSVIVLQYLENMDERLAGILAHMLTGLVGTSEWERAESIIAAWLDERRYVSEIAWCVRSVGALNTSLLAEILQASIDAHDADAVLQVVAAASSRHDDPQREIARECLLSGIQYLGKRDDLRWINALAHWPSPDANSLLAELSEAETRRLLEPFVQYQKIDYEAEELLVVFARMWPQAVIDFFGSRMKLDRVGGHEGYEALPFALHALDAVLAENAEMLLSSARGWFDEDEGLFQFRGGHLVAAVFPAFSDPLELLLRTRVETSDLMEIAFVLGILRAYSGQSFLHALCKEVVAALPDDDDLLDLVAIVLDSMGMTVGEFGRVEGLKTKKDEIEPWLEDQRNSVRAFATRHLHVLDQEIAAEQRRAEENLALRRLEFGEPADSE